MSEDWDIPRMASFSSLGAGFACHARLLSNLTDFLEGSHRFLNTWLKSELFAAMPISSWNAQENSVWPLLASLEVTSGPSWFPPTLLAHPCLPFSYPASESLACSTWDLEQCRRELVLWKHLGDHMTCTCQSKPQTWGSLGLNSFTNLFIHLKSFKGWLYTSTVTCARLEALNITILHFMEVVMEHRI